MKDNDKSNERKIESTKTNEQEKRNREHSDPLDKKETLAERARRENWTDVAESHLGIDE